MEWIILIKIDGILISYSSYSPARGRSEDDGSTVEKLDRAALLQILYAIGREADQDGIRII